MDRTNSSESTVDAQVVNEPPIVMTGVAEGATRGGGRGRGRGRGKLTRGGSVRGGHRSNDGGEAPGSIAGGQRGRGGNRSLASRLGEGPVINL